MGMMQEFKDFAVKGNVIDLAVGVIIGGAFGKIVDSAVKDLIMPLINWVLGGSSDFTNKFVVLSKPANYAGPETYEALNKAGANLFAWGSFVTILFNFLILAFVIFQMVKAFNKMKAAEPAPAAPATPDDILLLREIRDSLKK
jgi:large conductance mechanosensitive channel